MGSVLKERRRNMQRRWQSHRRSPSRSASSQPSTSGWTRIATWPILSGKQELVVEGMKFGYMRRGESGEPILEAETVLRKARHACAALAMTDRNQLSLRRLLAYPGSFL